MGALHDDRNSLFRFTLDAKDGCGHDRVVGMDSFEVELRLGSVVKFSLSSCALVVACTSPARRLHLQIPRRLGA